jgi:hypothetical protein
VRHVDGALAPEEAVKVGGVIVYDYNRLDLVKKLALEILKEFSPDKTGDYIAAIRSLSIRRQKLASSTPFLIRA